MERPALRAVILPLFLSLFCHHRLSHGACDSRGRDAGGAGLVVQAGLFQQPPFRPYSYRCTLLALRRRGLDRGFLHILHNATFGPGGMSAMRDPVGAAPDMRRMQFLWLLFACVAAPLFWLGQVILGYGVTSLVCYPGDHPDYL